MKLPPPVYADGLRKSTQVRFSGYEALGTEGAICDMKNLCGDYFPELASRPRRKNVRTVTTPQGMLGGDRLIWLDGTTLHIGSTSVANFVTGTGLRQIAVIGDYVTVWPDKVWYDIVAGTSGSLDAQMTTTAAFSSSVSPDELSDTNNCLTLGDTSVFKAGDAVEITGCTWRNNNMSFVIREVDGTKLYTYDNAFKLDRVLTAKSKGHAAGTYTIEHEDLPHIYSVTVSAAIAEGAVLTIPTDAILNGVTGAEKLTVTTNGTAVQYTLTQAQAAGTDLEETWYTDERDYTEASSITISRTAPALGFVFEHANRLWGCEGATIHASALGDPMNWNKYDGVATDSWSADTGSGGAFTGAIAYGGYPRFFKEEKIYTLYGDFPEEYQLQEHSYLGVNAGSDRSLAIVNGLLYYLSKVGPLIFQGAAPARITDAFGIKRYKNGVGGTDGKKYYISMQDTDDDSWHLFVYESGKGVWLKEDDLHALYMGTYDTELWCIDAAGKMMILGRPTVFPNTATDEGEIEWMAEFGDIAGNNPNKKRITKVLLRLELKADTRAAVYIKYDSEEETTDEGFPDGWRRLSVLKAKRKKTVLLPVIPRRLDHFRLKIEGTGPVRICSMAIESASGSDR